MSKRLSKITLNSEAAVAELEAEAQDPSETPATNKAREININQMQELVCNLTPPIRYDTYQGRKHMVVPAVMITEGVHAGSNGPLYYPSNELAKTPVVWNMKPVVVYHPVINGSPTSACDPVVAAKRQVGILFNTKYIPPAKGEPGKLKTEVWLDEAKLKEVDVRVFNALQKKQMVEVSTGLFTDNEQREGLHKGERYEQIARNYRPDHLAILPDEKGACSIADGAGLLRNSSEQSANDIREALQTAISPKSGSGPMAIGDGWVCDVFKKHFIFSRGGKYFSQDYCVEKGGKVTLEGDAKPVSRRTVYTLEDGTTLNTGAKKMTRKQMINTLIANGNFDDGDREYLQGLETDRLDVMVNNALQGDLATDGKNAEGKQPEGTVAAGKKTDKHKETGGGDLKTAATKTPSDEESSEEDLAPEGNEPTGDGVRNQEMTVEAFIANAPAGMRDMLAEGVRMHGLEKNKLIQIITANKANEFNPEYLKTRPMEELRAIAKLAAAASPVHNARPPMFTGQGDAGGGSAPSARKATALPVPVLNFQKKEK